MILSAAFSLQVKEYPGVNFTGLIYGPEGDNQIRLEKVITIPCLITHYSLC